MNKKVKATKNKHKMQSSQKRQDNCKCFNFFHYTPTTFFKKHAILSQLITNYKSISNWIQKWQVK